MTVQTSVVDHSGLDRASLEYIRTMRDFHKAIDPHFGLRMYLGRALAPPICSVLPIGDGLLLVARRIA